jgi:flagellar protein FliL
MAEQNNPAPEAKETVGGAPPEKKKGKGKLIMLLAIILIPLMAGGTVAYIQFEPLAAMLGLEIGTEHAEEEEEPITYGEFAQIEGMIINPADSGGKRYLLISVGLESHSPAALEELGAKEVVVRDTILKVLGVRTVNELADVALRNQIKDEIRHAVNDVLGEGKIDRMYFTQYVLQ